MKKIIFTLSLGMLLFTANGQQKQGKVLYERTVQMQMRMQGMGDEAAHLLPHTRKDKLEVLFDNNQSLRRTVEDDAPDEFSSAEGGMQIHMVMADANDVTYTNFATDHVVEQREFGAKNYIIADSIHKLNWKLTGETTTILNYPCQQAITQRIGKRIVTTMDNGEMKKQEVADTSNITVWFTPSIPVPAGPEYQGQLPGLILGIDINDSRSVYKAIEVSAQADLSAIKEPSKGKKVTTAEFAKERDKLVEEMQRNNSGGKGRSIRISQ
ncbi:GLPGLI family protein [Chitinophaga niastensis]|uniref:GLPGLI family protein n=1 Tax=Chitinophaga niastensis TaxID=536980 RepID=A0A2P8HHD3_CHINA|nr:GLPGLI family protein [Chitinophaga niastensis]PSL45599.1 GLPGLI family protein [Chitinophaga niastensis]